MRGIANGYNKGPEFGHRRHIGNIDQLSNWFVMDSKFKDSVVNTSSSVDKRFYDQPEKTITEFEEAPLYVALLVYVQYAVLVFFGYLRDFFGFRRRGTHGEHLRMQDFVPLYSDFEAFYTRNLYNRINDAWNRPISTVPGDTITVYDRFNNVHKSNVINMGSYNYLGFAQNNGACARESMRAIKKFGVATCSSSNEFGNMIIHKNLEKSMARFLGVQDCICFPMGFNTNASTLPCLIGKDGLILSDELNHASIVLGCRLSGACVVKFKHNDMHDLECKLKQAVVYGQRRTMRPFKKILICVEGVYSMEGSIVDLPKVLELKKRYKAYVYLDEAHSIGAVGSHGRGVCDYYNCDPKAVDILMGTFTKSFGSAGGYVAGSHALISRLRVQSQNTNYACTVSAPLAQQIISSLSVISGQDGTDEGRQRIQRLRQNSVYFRKRLKQSGFIVYGNVDSPVVPLMLYYPTVISFFSRELLKRRIGTVVVGFPATSITLARARFCISASHSQEQLDQTINEINRLGDMIGLKFVKDKHFINQTIDYGKIV